MKNKIFVALIVILCGVFSASAQDTASAGWKVSFGADERLRAENKRNFDFNDALGDNGSLVYQRVRLNGKAAFENKYEFFSEVMDLRVGNINIPKTAQGDNLDLHQAYAGVKSVFGLPLEVKAGRQELKYGQGRLLWAATWGNRINHFDGAVLKYKSGGLSADAFHGERVSYDDDGWNDPNRHDVLSGAYLSYRKDKDTPLVEGYFLSNYDSSNMSTLNRRTVGVRGQVLLPGAVLCDLEIPYQFGTSSRKSVYARAFHLDLSREFERAWSPRVAAALNYASGDKNPSDSVNNTFVPLYQSVHEPYGVMDFFRWQNMRETALEISVKPEKKLKITAAANFFWLARAKDSWYDSAGKKLRTNAAGAAGTYVGQEASLLAKYDMSRWGSLEGGYARFFTGKYVKNTGAHDDAGFFYFQLSLKI